MRGPSRSKTVLRQIPHLDQPAIEGLMCGVIGLAYPQILFFGYATLNALHTFRPYQAMVSANVSDDKRNYACMRRKDSPHSTTPRHQATLIKVCIRTFFKEVR